MSRRLWTVLVIAVLMNVGWLNIRGHSSVKRDIRISSQSHAQKYESLRRDIYLLERLNDLSINLNERVSRELVQRDDRISAIYQKSIRGIVRIEIQYTYYDRFSGEEVIGTSAAAGIVLDREGHILTNAHVVDAVRKHGIANSRVRFWDGKVSQVTSCVLHDTWENNIGRVPDWENVVDLGIIKVDPIDVDFYSPITFGNMQNLNVGNTILAIGHPLVDNMYSLSVGAVSRIGLFKDGSRLYIQTDAAINPGNSGGPVIGLDGECYGLVSFGYGTNGLSCGLSWCIPVSTLQKEIPVLLKKLRGEE